MAGTARSGTGSTKGRLRAEPALVDTVEVAGIEPASCSDEPGLLRAQLVLSFYSAPALAPARRRQAQSQFMSLLGPQTCPNG